MSAESGRPATQEGTRFFLRYKGHEYNLGFYLRQNESTAGVAFCNFVTEDALEICQALAIVAACKDFPILRVYEPIIGQLNAPNFFDKEPPTKIRTLALGLIELLLQMGCELYAENGADLHFLLLIDPIQKIAKGEEAVMKLFGIGQKAYSK